MFLRNLEEYKYAPFIVSEYSYLAGRAISGSSEYALPQIGELVEETWRSVAQEVLVNDIQAAIMRKEHEEIYSMDKKTFTRLALKGDLHSFQESPVKIIEVRDQILGYLSSRNMSYMDYYDNVINSPIGRGVW